MFQSWNEDDSLSFTQDPGIALDVILPLYLVGQCEEAGVKAGVDQKEWECSYCLDHASSTQC